MDRIEAETGVDEDDTRPQSVAATLRIAYLLSRYPAVSHTFFLHEVLGLRARGLHIETASINAPDRALTDLPELEAVEAATTLYLKAGSKPALIGRVLAICATHPGVLLRGLRRLIAIRGLTLRQRAFWLFYLAEALLLGRWIRERRLTHLHVHFGGAVASVGMLAASAWRIPYSITIHGPEELLNVDAYRLRDKVDQASFVLCISDFCRSQLYQLTDPATWHKFHVVRLGVDPMSLTPQTRSGTSGAGPALSTSARTLELVCVGRLVPAKGHRILLEALHILRERRVRLHVTLIGDGPERLSLEQYVQGQGLTHAVHFTSALSHAQAITHVARADIFALASFAEGIPVALMEAMALGVPCVSTTIAGIPELIRDGRDGLLVPPANALALADALESLIVDPNLRRSLAHSARQRVISLYNLPLNQELLAQTFEAHLLPSLANAAPGQTK